jgi:hypothetical protein
MWMPRLAQLQLGILIVALCGAAAADERDGGHAAARRWTHPDGPASGSYRSLTAAPEDFGGIRWTYKARDTLLAPPLVWDDAVFVLDGDAKSAQLVALDAEDGVVLAREKVQPGPAPGLAVYARSVFLREEGALVQYRLRRKKFERRWEFDVGADASAPRVLGGEIYVATSKGLLRLRAGLPVPVWTAEGPWMGTPAVFRGHVYGLKRSGSGAVAFVAVKREDGKAAATVEFEGGGGARVAVAEEVAAARLLGRRWALLARKEEKDELTLTFKRREELTLDPLLGSSLFIALRAKPPLWHFLRLIEKHPANPLGRGREDLVDGAAACVSLGGPVICFGAWCADVNQNEIMWNLHGTKEFPHGVRFNAVPADDRRILLVPKDGKRLHLIGPEEIG